MEYKRFGNTIVLRMDVGDEVLDVIKQVSLKENIKLAHLSGIGAVDNFIIGAYSVPDRQYHKNEFKGVYEITSLDGNINTMNGEFYSHLHINCGGLDGSVVGGHLNMARISGTGEIFITIIDGEVDRTPCDKTGLNILKF